MKVLDLFSGIGGFSLGLEAAGMETAAFCEYDEKARKVLRKNWPDVSIFNDIRTLNKESLERRGIYDIGLICGGYPCQPFSLAGERRGAEDDRHLWPEMLRLVQELRPTWVIGENVAGHITMGLNEVLADLESENYTARPFVIPACAIDAPHRRDRVWTIAHASELQRNGSAKHRQQVKRQIPQFRKRGSKEHERCTAMSMATWQPEPSVGRVANGVPNRTHRLRQLGNAVVPQVVQVIGEMILRTEQMYETNQN